MDMVNICWGKIDVMTLPAKEVNEPNKKENSNTSRGRPNVDRIAEKEVFNC